jgi:hypothetical protein
MLEATIGLNEVEEEDTEPVASNQSGDKAEGPFSRNDLNFLKSLRISLPETESDRLPGSRPALPSNTSESNSLGDSSVN